MTDFLPSRGEPAGASLPDGRGIQISVVRGVQLHRLPEVQDPRGYLCVAEFERDLPFVPRRCFWVHAVPSQKTRGEHAHLRCAQFLIAMSGRLRVVADDGRQREEFWLDRPSLGLYLPPMTWGIQDGYSKDAVLMVLASEPYQPQDYIRDYAEFQRMAPLASDGASLRIP